VPKLSHLCETERTVTVRFEDTEETLTVSYRPMGFTPLTEERLQECQEQGRIGRGLVSLLLDCLVGWDLLDDKGKPLAIDNDTLQSLPLNLLARIVSAIGEDMRPNPQSAGSFGAG